MHIWYQLKTYMRARWEKAQDRICKDPQLEQKALDNFVFDFGEKDVVYTHDSRLLFMPRIPLEPD